MTSPRTLLIHYTILLALLFGGGVIIVIIPTPQVRWMTISIVIVTYLIWAIWHHYENKTLTKEVICEYLGMLGIIGLILFMLS